MVRLWKWLFVNRKAEALNAEITRLHSEIAEYLVRQDEWRAASEAASRERELAQAESEAAFAKERNQAAVAISDLQYSVQQLETNLATNLQKSRQLELSMSSMNDLVQFRDRQIEEMQATHSHEVQAYETKLQNLQQIRQDLEVEITSKLEASLQQIAELTSSKKRHADEMAKASAKIHDLEKQLSESESHSENRAEQRSALLRNLAEIHRLSSFVTKSELLSSPLKLIQHESNGSENPELSKWTVYGEVESA